MRKHTLAIWAVCLGLLAVRVSADVPGPGWEQTDPGTVHAEWTDWTQFNTGLPYGPDEWSAYDLDGNANDPAAFGTYGMPDALGIAQTHRTPGFPPDPDGTDGVTIESNWDFSTWVPTFEDQDVLDVYLEVTYWDFPSDPEWRQGWDLSVEAFGPDAMVHAISEVGEFHDTQNGLITEAYTFSITDSPEGFFVDFNADPELSFDNPAYLYALEIDGLSYNPVPEPGVLSCVLAGMSVLILRRRTNR